MACFEEDQAFSPSYDLAPSPPPPPHPSVSKLSLFFSLPVCRWSSLLTGEGDARGWERNRESLVLYRQYSLVVPTKFDSFTKFIIEKKDSCIRLPNTCLEPFIILHTPVTLKGLWPQCCFIIAPQAWVNFDREDIWVIATCWYFCNSLMPYIYGFRHNTFV
jgi:hypothetical protein